MWADDIAAPPSPSRLRAYLVCLAPDARTAWHEHPYGQALYVTESTGLIQRAGGPVEEIHAGDSWFAPGERHWHGAAPTSYLAHIAIREADEHGSTAAWVSAQSGVRKLVRPCSAVLGWLCGLWVPSSRPQGGAPRFANSADLEGVDTHDRFPAAWRRRVVALTGGFGGYAEVVAVDEQPAFPVARVGCVKPESPDVCLA